MRALNETIGGKDLCAWQPVAGVTWVQTRIPKLAQKLAKRQDSRLVMRGVHGGYLRTFEFKHTLGWAERLIKRYTRAQTAANDGLNAKSSPP